MTSSKIDSLIQHIEVKQINNVFDYLSSKVAIALKMYGPNIYHHKRQLQKAGKLWQTQGIICPITQNPGWLIASEPATNSGGSYA